MCRMTFNEQIRRGRNLGQSRDRTPLNKIGNPYWTMDQRVIGAGVLHMKRPKSRAAKAA